VLLCSRDATAANTVIATANSTSPRTSHFEYVRRPASMAPHVRGLWGGR
jgi:hypothetical protein